ncbi:ankyrin repeat domain-containing protein [Pontivivens nitratireducens]|uniref:Ankyrin repeat domain-containing protein n=1 Tax=Pontivivens nitratireducens TaxID=2758038 RepID=A0A6G7VME9_9RHOB|nr:ankyrin repeat domain-containing protein [Pontibrevibacter nitratireducens]QIK41046.1 ankyrin repeat domain-containing protein [Pontibrevibacter nitratireducens]
MKYPIYTPFQKYLLRRELLMLHDFGTEDFPRRLSWSEIVDQIAAYTDLPLDGGAYSSADAGNEDREKHAETQSLKFYTNKIQEFVKRPNRKFPKSGMPIDYVLKHFVDYLCHPEIKRLSYEQLANPQIGLDAGARLAEFAWDGLVVHALTEQLDGSVFSSPSIEGGKRGMRHLCFEHFENSCLYALAEIVTAGKKTLSIDHGWAVALPGSEIQLFFKRTYSNEFANYIGTQRDSHVYIVPTKSIAAPDSNINVSKVVEFMYNEDGLIYSPKKKLPQKISRFSSGAEINIFMDEITGKDLIDAIVGDDLTKFEELVEAGVDVNYRDSQNGWTALHHIAWLSRVEELEIISKRDDLDYLIKDLKGRDPADLAAENGWGDPEVLEFLSKQRSEQYHNSAADIDFPEP